MVAAAKSKPVEKAKKRKFKTFAYEGTDKRNNTVKGEVMAENQAMAKAELRRMGVVPKTLKQKSALAGGGGKRKKISSVDVMIFTRQLATMMKSGVPLVQSFEIVADGLDNMTMRELVLNVKSEIEGGNNLADSLRNHPQYFDELMTNLVEAGEQAGALETLLDRIALYKEKTEALKQKIKKAMKYPIGVLVVASVVTAILLLKVVPTFEELFSGFGADLPAFTQLVINMSRSLQASWYFYVMAIIGIVMTLKVLKEKSAAFNVMLDKLQLKMPVIGPIVNKSTVARYARTLATTFAAGVPLVEALDSVAGATGNSIYKNAVLKIKEEVSTGTQLGYAMKQSGLFPPMALQMVAIGEESGALDTMLEKVATYFEDEVDNLVDGLLSLMEPMIMSFLGIVIGGLIIAMYLPIFSMGNAFG